VLPGARGDAGGGRGDGTGVSTRDAEAVLRACGIERLSSAQVSRAASLLDAEAEAWRTRPPGEVQYLARCNT
jgi:transposase-like protein